MALTPEQMQMMQSMGWNFDGSRWYTGGATGLNIRDQGTYTDPVTAENSTSFGNWNKYTPNGGTDGSGGMLNLGRTGPGYAGPDERDWTINLASDPTIEGDNVYLPSDFDFGQAGAKGVPYGEGKMGFEDYAMLGAILGPAAWGALGGTFGGFGAAEGGELAGAAEGGAGYGGGSGEFTSWGGGDPSGGYGGDYGWGDANPYGGGGINGSGLNAGYGTAAATAGAGGAAGPMTLSQFFSQMGDDPMGTLKGMAGGLGVKDVLGAGFNYAMFDKAQNAQRDYARQMMERSDAQSRLGVQEAQKNRDFQAEQSKIARDFQTDFASKYNPLTMSALNQPERKPYQVQFEDLTKNPGNFFNTDPMALAHQDMAKRAYEASGAKHGFGGTVFNDYMKNLTDDTAQDYNIRSDQLLTAGGYKFGPGGLTLPGANNSSGTQTQVGAGSDEANTAAKLFQGSIPTSMTKFEGFGNLFGGNPQGSAAGKNGLNFNNPFGSSTVAS